MSIATIQAAFFLIFGVGLLAVDYQSLAKGSLPCGPNGLKGRVEFSRRDQPALYWLMFAVYGAGGLWLIVTAVRLLTGAATPLPLR
jgi:hypothetical protein